VSVEEAVVEQPWSRQTNTPGGEIDWEPIKGSELKNTKARFKEYLEDDQDGHFRDHLHMGAQRDDGSHVEVIGDVWQMHGPVGVCTCCPRGTAS